MAAAPRRGRRLPAWGLILCLAVAGCAPASLPTEQWQRTEIDRVWPEPPLQARIRYLRQVGGEAADDEDRSRARRVFEWFAGEDPERVPLVSPYGVAADGAGRVWVADPGSRVVQAFDLARRRVAVWQTAGREGPFAAPVGVAYDGEGRIFVSDAVRARVFVLDTDGRLVGRVGADDAFGRPTGLHIAGGLLYVADAARAAVEVFTLAGEHRRTIRGAGPSGGFRSPVAVAAAADGTVFVLDSLHFRVEVQDAGGSFLRYIGGLGDAPGYFARPRGLALDGDGHLYVSDAAFDNVQIFNASGRLLLYWGENGTGPGEFNLPAYLCIDAGNRIYVADSQNHRIQVFAYLP